MTNKFIQTFAITCNLKGITDIPMFDSIRDIQSNQIKILVRLA